MQKSGQIDAARPIQSPKCKKPGQTTGLLQYLKRRGLKAAAGEYRSGNQELITLLALDPFWRLAAARPGITRNWVTEFRRHLGNALYLGFTASRKNILSGQTKICYQRFNFFNRVGIFTLTGFRNLLLEEFTLLQKFFVG